MIDTDNYEGHTPGQWSVTSIRDGSIPWNTADEELCADAPLLLAEVKRLNVEVKELLDDMAHIVENYLRDGDPAAAVLFILDGRKTIEKITGSDAREYFARLYDEPEGDDE